MPVRFAVATGNWSNTAIWDNGALPVAGDTVHPNGFTVTIDQDINVASLNNNIPPNILPNSAIPLMTGNTQPSGTVNAGSDTSNAWKVFDLNNGTSWGGTGLNSTAWVSYQFSATKIIKRYYLHRNANNDRPISWIFQGSNDGSTWDNLETVTGNTATTPYTSPILSNTTAYLYYRFFVVAVNSGTTLQVFGLEMTESVGTVYGTTTGGSFTVPASLSGTRNIVQTGDGMRCATSTTLFTIAATSGATVNFNVQSGGYIFNPQWISASSSSTKGVNITGNCAVNFNSNIWGSTGAFFLDTTGAQIYIGAAATVTINGNVYAPLGAGSSGNYFQIHMPATLSNSAILNINGDILASNGSNLVYPIYNLSASTINIVGNLTSNISICVQATSAAINVTGNIGMTLGTSLAAISSGGSTLTMNGSITNKGNKMAVSVPFLRFASTATPVWIFQTNAGTDMALSYGTPVTGSYPAEADVRYNTPYGASPTRYGTLRVPLPQYVSQGVLTDNTTGTAYLSATDVWNVLTSNITTAGSIGERLKNASTVQTNGDQLAAYIV